jgi:hypothetical protein
MRKPLKRFPIHTFLFIPFLVLFLLNYNYSQVAIYMIVRTLILGTGLTACLFLLFRLVLNENQKTGIFTTLTLLAFFNYGILYELLEKVYYSGAWPMHNIHRYLLGIYFLGFVIALFLFKKAKKDLSNHNFFMNTTVGILLLYNVLSLFFHASQSKSHMLHDQQAPFKQLSTKDVPDIYYIVLDGYANSNVLKKYYDFDNAPFLNHLKAENFFVADSAFSNYYYTQPSLTSTLNLSYLSPELNSQYLLSNNFLFHTLQSYGYDIINIKSGYSVTAAFKDLNYSIPIAGANEFERALMKYTILRLDDLAGIMAFVRLQSQFYHLKDFFTFNEKPKFCFIHIVSPHPPYVLTKKGEFRIHKSFGDNSWAPKASYLDQLSYTTTQIDQFVQKILEQKQKIRPVIIIQSDHGPWINSPSRDDIFEARSGILNAILLPKDDMKKLYPSVSSVNTFRIVLSSVLKPVFEKKVNP